MGKIDFLLGVMIGIIACLIGSYIFVEVFTNYEFITGIAIMRSEGVLGKVITLGAILNVVLFFILLKFDKEMMARGVILATILLTIVTLFI